jgi:hypothetical protein
MGQVRGKTGQTSPDSVTVDIIGAHLLAIAEEMGVALIRAAYSPNIKERHDCSTSLLDRDGQTIAQAEHIPLHMGSMLGVECGGPFRLAAGRGHEPAHMYERRKGLEP